MHACRLYEKNTATNSFFMLLVDKIEETLIPLSLFFVRGKKLASCVVRIVVKGKIIRKKI